MPFFARNNQRYCYRHSGNKNTIDKIVSELLLVQNILEIFKVISFIFGKNLGGYSYNAPFGFNAVLSI